MAFAVRCRLEDRHIGCDTFIYPTEVQGTDKEKQMKRWIIIMGLGALAILCGSGCSSLRNLKELDFGITGLELEFYPSHPSQEEKGFFGSAELDDKFKIEYVPVRLIGRSK